MLDKALQGEAGSKGVEQIEIMALSHSLNWNYVRVNAKLKDRNQK